MRDPGNEVVEAVLSVMRPETLLADDVNQT